MPLDPHILSLIVRRTRQLKRVKYPPTQETLVHYVHEKLGVAEDVVVEQLKLAVEQGELKQRNCNNYISYTFPEGKVHTSPLAKSPSPSACKIVRKMFTSPPVKKSLKIGQKATTHLVNSARSRSDRPVLEVDESKDLSRHIKTALVRMERPYGSSIKVLAQYFQKKFRLKIKIARGEDSDKALHDVLVRSANLGVRRGLLSKVDRMFRVAPCHMYKTAPDGPITEKLQSAFITLRKEKERNKKSANASVLCSFCLKPAAENRDGQHESMVSCVTCGNSGHPSCLKWSEELNKKVSSLPSWECLECKWCSVCREPGNDGMLFCDSCDRGYHLECCEPALSKLPKGDWACLLCLFERYDAEQMQKYLETHKSPRRSFSPSMASTSVKYQLSPSRRSGVLPKSRKKSSKSNADCSDSGEDNSSGTTDSEDVPLRSSSAETPSSAKKKKKKDRDDSALAKYATVVPEQLIDPLTKYYTPSNKRKSAVARKSFESLAHVVAALAKQRKQPRNNRQAADKLVRRSRKELTKQAMRKSEKMRRSNDVKKKRKSSTDEERTDADSLPEHCTATDLEWFKKSEMEAKQSIGSAEEVSDSGRYPPMIVLGRFQIQTWYSAPYPQEYAKLPKLWICEFCLQYAKSRGVLERHMVKCDLRSPPGDEIYRHGSLSVYEVDGQTSKLYCQNLCLLAKLFLDHKTLYYDVEPFLFYVLTVNDAFGSHIAGYFSKEKLCAQKYNVSCIMILPTYQRTGYGRFLVSFSYLLSRQEQQPGTPERPLSELGRLAYQAYWRDQILEYLVKNPDSPALVIHDISQRTGMSPHDIAATMQELGLVRTASDGSNRLVVVVDEAQLRDYKERLARKPPVASLEPSALRWTPPVSSHANNSGANGSSLIPPPAHNEFIEGLKAQPPPPPPKKHRRRRKMSPWRRPRRRSNATVKKKTEEEESQHSSDDSSKNESSADEQSGESGDEEAGGDSVVNGTKTGRVSPSKKTRKISKANKDKGKDPGKKGMLKRRGRRRTKEEEDENEEDDDSDTSDNDSSDEDDDDTSSQGGGAANGRSGSSSSNGDDDGSRDDDDSSKDGPSSSSSGGDSQSQTGTSSASDALGVPQGNELDSKCTVLKDIGTGSPLDAFTKRRSTRSSAKRLSSQTTAFPAVRTKENVAHHILSLEQQSPLVTVSSPVCRRRSGVLPQVAIDSSQFVSSTISRSIPPAKEAIRSRRSGVKPHRVASVLQPEASNMLLLRNVGLPYHSSTVPLVSDDSLGTGVENPLLSMESSATGVELPISAIEEKQQLEVQQPRLPSPSVHSKVEAAVATLRKEQKVLGELVNPSTLDLEASKMPDMMGTFFPSSELISMDEELAMPRPPCATVASVAASQGIGEAFGSTEFTTLRAPSPAKSETNYQRTFTTLKAPASGENVAGAPNKTVLPANLVPHISHLSKPRHQQQFQPSSGPASPVSFAPSLRNSNASGPVASGYSHELLASRISNKLGEFPGPTNNRPASCGPVHSYYNTYPTSMGSMGLTATSFESTASMHFPQGESMSSGSMFYRTGQPYIVPSSAAGGFDRSALLPYFTSQTTALPQVHRGQQSHALPSKWL